MVETNATNQSIRIAGRPAGSSGATATRWALYASLIVASFFMLAPLFWMVCAVFKTSGDMWTYTLLPYDMQEKIEVLEGKDKGAKRLIDGNAFSIGTAESDTVRLEKMPD